MVIYMFPAFLGLFPQRTASVPFNTVIKSIIYFIADSSCSSLDIESVRPPSPPHVVLRTDQKLGGGYYLVIESPLEKHLWSQSQN